MGGGAGGSARARGRAHRLGKDPRRVPVGARPAGGGRPAAGSAAPLPGALRVTAEGTGGRRAAQPALPAHRHPAGGPARRSAAPEVTVGMRTGDTPADERRLFARTPPDVLVTTPESLFLLLTSAARESLRGVRTVILDEVHAVAGTKRGAHLALSLERLDALLVGDGGAPAQRIGLSATVQPLHEVATFLAGAQPVEVVQPPIPKTIEVSVEVPVPDLAALDERPAPGSSDEEVVGSAAGTAQRPSIWPAVERRLLELVRQHRSTIVFSNSRRLAERLTARLNELAAEEAEEKVDLETFPAEAIGQSGIGGGARPSSPRRTTDRCPASSGRWSRRSSRAGCCRASSRRRASSWASTWARWTSSSRSRRRQRRLRTAAGRPGRAPGGRGLPGVVFPKFRSRPHLVARWSTERMVAGRAREPPLPANPLDVLRNRSWRCVAIDSWTGRATWRRWCAGPRRSPDCPIPPCHAVLTCWPVGTRREAFGELRPRLVWDRVTQQLHRRPGAQRLAVTSGGTIPDRGPLTVTSAGWRRRPGSRVGELDEEMVYESRVGDTFLLGTSSWRVEDITHDRVIVIPAPGVPARMPFWKGESIGRPLELGRAIGAFRPGDGRAGRRRRAAPGPTIGGLDGWAVGQPAVVPGRAARGDPARAQRPDDPRRAVPRRAGRLAARGALPRSVPRSTARGRWRSRRPDAGTARVEVPPPGRTTASSCACRTPSTTGRRGRADGRGRAARPRRRSSRSWWPELRRLVAVRVAVPRVRGARPAAAPPRPEAAVAAVAAAAAVRAAAGGRREVRAVPGDAGGDARVRPGRLRPAGRCAA